MESNMFNAIGMAGLDPAILFLVLLVLLIGAFVIIILQGKRLKNLERKYSKFMQGKEAESLEEEIVGLFHDNRMIRSENEKNRKDIININKRLNNSFQKIGLEK